jgi:hypothetical protein
LTASRQKPDCVSRFNPYYFHNERIPLYLLTVFAKNERADLNQAERNALVKLVDILVDPTKGN